MVRKRTGSLLGAIYVLVGASLLGSALFAPWYFYDNQFGRWSGPSYGIVGARDTTFFLASLPGGEPVQVSCLGEAVPNFCPISSSYSGAGFNSTGTVAALTFVLAAAGFAVGAIGGILGVILRRTPRSVFPELMLTLVAVGLAIAATAAFVVLLPGAFAHDIPASQQAFEPAGPWSSFFGSVTIYPAIPCPNPGCLPITVSWGPSIGWSFSVAAIAVLLVGAVMMIRFRHDDAECVPSAASAAPTHGSNTRSSTT
ncbi:MAG TPA: hypothetical protein VJ021_01375 [Thermoplasmata archaeon]|nr:hypothetical protein [Thermoplasmata archaeon]